ncbi:TetR/AcrR family transcriptional regulator [Xanthobacter sp. DSM 24535]|uniref:TetR/AcrR family transcriptional regulator n=1 Tax=Roseixanthobacter psychrophilus TaxID=3119917 RepID=UPI003727996D
MTCETTRDACLRAFLDLLAQRRFEKIALADVVAHAGVPLSQMRVEYGSTYDLLDAFARATDRRVLSESGADQAGPIEGESAQERLFEVLMRRLDALEPHRDAVASLMRSARGNPVLALHLLRIGTQSQHWMLAAASIDTTGLAGDVRARGLAVLFARIVDVWLKDEDPGLARTMAALDRELGTGAKMLDALDDLAFIAIPWRKRRRSAVEPPAADAGVG